MMTELKEDMREEALAQIIGGSFRTDTKTRMCKICHRIFCYETPTDRKQFMEHMSKCRK